MSYDFPASDRDQVAITKSVAIVQFVTAQNAKIVMNLDWYQMLKQYSLLRILKDWNFENFEHLNERMEELRISSDNLDEATCIIENYKILKLEKFEQGKLSKRSFSNTVCNRSRVTHERFHESSSAGAVHDKCIEVISHEQIRNELKPNNGTKILKTETCFWKRRESWTVSTTMNILLTIGQEI